MKISSGIFVLAMVISFQSCTDSDSSNSPAVTETTSAGKDLTQDFTIAISGAQLEAPANSLAAGTSITLKSGTQPTEFAPTGTTTSVASGVTELSATDSAGKKLEKAVAPLTLAIDLTAPAGLTPFLADVDKTAENLCVLGKGADGVVRRWPKSRITLDTKSKISFPSIWFGTFQVLYCGTAFDSIPEVNAAGDDVVTATTTPVAAEPEPTTGSGTETASTSSATTDGTCNTLRNQGKLIYPDEEGGETPTGTGGTPEKGTYVLSGFVVYASSPITPNTSLNQTLEYNGPSDVQIVSNDNGGETVRESYTMKTSGIAPNLTRTCVTDEDNTAIPYTSYTTTATSITFYAETTYHFSVTYTKI